MLNNTNRSHELVDLIAKVGSDKDLDFDFINNEKLKESGFALNGKTVNGFLSDSGVTVNINSAKALNSVVGHEITHVLEGTGEFYTALESMVTEIAKTKGEYNARLTELRSLYADVEGYKGADGHEKIKKELVADLVGDYIFTDTEFIKRLSTENRNLFEKVYDEIQYLCRVATAGSKEARQLEKAKKAFEDAYRQDTKNTAEDGGVRYSLVGRTAGGEGIYKTNYPDNTPKSVKQADLVDIVQNVWSEKPIELTIVENGEYKQISAKFNGELSERSDLAKIAFGNRKGTGPEKRMTLDLASDLYQIAQESRFNYSKDAIPKPDNPAHDGVTKYHYFITNIVYKSNAGEYIPCHMNIDVKRNGEGDWFYSFAIEKGSAPQTLLAAVTDDSATLPSTRIAAETENVNRKLLLSSQEDLFPVRKDLDAVRGNIYGSDVELEDMFPVRQDLQSEETAQDPYDDLPFDMPENLEEGQLSDAEYKNAAVGKTRRYSSVSKNSVAASRSSDQCH